MQNSIRPSLVAVGLVGVCLFLFGVWLDDHALRLITKPIPLLVMMAFVCRRHLYGKIVLGALAFSLLGDVLLEVSDAMFVFGLGAFLIAHVVYCVAFVMQTRKPCMLEVLPFVAWVGWMDWFMWDRFGDMRIPVVVYTVIIGVMMWRATAVTAQRKSPHLADWSLLVGAIVFGLSDSLIAINKFHAPFDGARSYIILTYWVAQALLVYSTYSPVLLESDEEVDET